MRALVFSIDDAYVVPFKVLWHSLMKTESIPEETPIFILHAETLSRTSVLNIADFLERHARTATFEDAGSLVPDHVPLSHHISKATYYRLFLASILPDEITSVVYLDSDALAIRSISELFQLRLTNPIAAADHMSPRQATRLWGGPVGSYFQAGVMLADLNKWRANQLEDTFKRILKEDRERIVWWDQDVLNIAFANDWQRLPIWYNLCRQARSKISRKAAEENGCFLHFDGSSKPWTFHSKDWAANAWYAVYFESFREEFDKKRIQPTIWQSSSSAAKRIVRRLLGRT